MGWWLLWVAFTGMLALAAWLLDDRPSLYAMGVVLLGLLASRVAVTFTDSSTAMMAVWAAVAVYLFSAERYGMAVFSAMSAACYFPLWTSYFAADVFGVLMLFAAGGSIGGNAVSSTDRHVEVVASSSAIGPLYFRRSRGDT